MRKVSTYKPTKLQLDIIADGVQNAVNEWCKEYPYDESLPKEELQKRIRTAEELTELLRFTKMCKENQEFARMYFELDSLTFEEQQTLND